jgi:ribosomal protein S18 acetylase RimI-like enzyme
MRTASGKGANVDEIDFTERALPQLVIRPAAQADAEAMLSIFDTVLAGGDTYPMEADTDRAASHAYWLGPGVRSFVATGADGRVCGMYRLVPNQPGRGAHVANASFIVDPGARGAKLGWRLGQHCLAQARSEGYLAMQFNFVVSTNAAAVHLWQKLGFAIVATLPRAYRHAQLGYVDAYFMYQLLSDPSGWPG